MESYRLYQQSLLQDKPAEALQHLQQHLRANRQHALAFYQLGNLHRSLGHWSQSLCAHLEACRLDPETSDFHLNLGVTYQGLQQLDLAIKAYEKAYEKDNKPKIRFNRSQALLQAGRYQEGWQEYEWRQKMPEHQAIFNWYNSERRWQGQPFPGQTLVVYHEQGFGDAIQFCRLVAAAKAFGGTVIFAVKAALIPLLSTLHGPDRIVEHCEATYKNLQFNWAVPLLSLPFYSHLTLESIPNQTPYLAVPPDYRKKWQTLLAPHQTDQPIKKIGFVFACYPESASYLQRSCPLSLWRQLFELANIQWFSLQKGTPAQALAEMAAGNPNVINLSEKLDDFADTAALIEQLDLVISIDTSVAHLAGALDIPTWLLLPFDNEWRWLQRRSDSPWYPSMRLFRQPLPGQWPLLIERVCQALTNGQPFLR